MRDLHNTVYINIPTHADTRIWQRAREKSDRMERGEETGIGWNAEARQKGERDW